MPTLVLSVSGARGIVGDGLDESVARRLAAAFASVVGCGTVVLGRDSRPSGPLFATAARRVLEERGCQVTDLGIVPTPTVQVAVEHGDAVGGIIITASHNPPAWNALKFVGPDGRFLDRTRMRPLLDHFLAGDTAEANASESNASESNASAASAAAVNVSTASAAAVNTSASSGTATPSDESAPTTPAGAEAIARHIDLITATIDTERIRASKLKVVADMVHGAGQVLIAPLLEELGVQSIWIHGEPNGALPAHPEPRREMLEPLRERVRAEGADFGFASDPDGDRCAFVLPEDTVGEEGTLPLCAMARLEGGMRGTLVTNLSTSAWLEIVASRYDCTVRRAPVGEANVVSCMLVEEARFGGEGNGGVIDPAVHLGRDAGVAAALLLQLETSYGSAGRKGRGGLRDAWKTLPARAMVKEKLTLGDAEREHLWEELLGAFGVPENTEDGLRWSWEDEWIHIRPSGTEPIVRLIAEATTAQRARARVRKVADLLEHPGG